MTDIEIAERELEGHSVCFCKNGEFFTEDGRGIAPLMRVIERGTDLSGYSCADLIVGKAAAMLFVKAGIKEVYGKTMSESAKEFLNANGIAANHGALTKSIVNRDGTDICPMEKTVLFTEDADEAFIALKAKLNELKNKGETK
ncbi:MAG: DUF1893 domain-containing protein [Clostridia bacterium]|nr:DUF1893 domain-containing protein [Clostridia bacterium]